MSWRARLKRFPLARKINDALKCRQMKRRYELHCRRYATPSVLTSPDELSALTAQRWSSLLASQQSSEVRRPRVLFVGTDYEQDRSGLLQALERAADVHRFEQAPGVYGQRWPRNSKETDEVRSHNARVLLETLERVGPVDLVIGQMWGLSMHWRALASVRERGMGVINIAMDDRHAWRGMRLDDGTCGGTRSRAPYLTLACTAAAECVGWYEAEGTRAIFLPEGSDGGLFAPDAGAKTHDVAFVGARYGVRDVIIAALERAGLGVETYGTGWPNGRIATEDVPALFARSRIVLGSGLIGACDDFVALKLRDFDATMSGSLYVTHANPDLYALFAVGKELVTFRRTSELVDLVRHYVDAADERESIARAGRERSLREHTWDHRVRAMLDAAS